MTAANTLRRELQYFAAQREELLKHYNSQFAVVKGDALIATYSSFEEAYAGGVTRFGSEPFLVKRITQFEPTQSAPALCVGLISAGT